MSEETIIEAASESSASRQTGGATKRIFLFAVLVVVAGGLYSLLGDRLSLEQMEKQEAALRGYLLNQPFWATMVAIAIYMAVAGLSLPGASVLSLACGWYFGFWLGLMVVSFGSTGGATLAFLLTRYLLRDWVQHKFTHRLRSINDAFDREGAFYLFTLRLIPAVPFFIVNAVMGLTRVRLFTFWWVSQLGMLPGTIAYVYAGSSVPSLKQLASEGVGRVISWQLLLGFAILGVLPIAMRQAVSVFRKQAL
jgi:uncharacterized membrane protein YdjX (TVP38/TMEM64 family)